MGIFDLVTPMLYWVITILWLVIVGIYLVKIRQLKAVDGAISGTLIILLVILTVDAFRTIVESVYFGLYFNSLYGLIPKGIHDLLSRPDLLIIPKFINIAAALLIILLLLRYWLPKELKENFLAFEEAKKVSLNNQILYTSIFDGITDAFFFADKNRNIISVNHSLEIMLGYSADELVGENVSILYRNTEEYDQYGQMYFNQTAEERVKPYEANYQRKDGSMVVGETTRIVVKDVDGQIQGTMGLIRDVTERNKTEKELRTSQEALAYHIQNTPLGYISRDKNSNCIEMNKSAEAIFGYSEDEVRGRCLLDLLVPEAIRGDIENIIQQILQNNEGSININENITKNGRRIICEWHDTPIVNENGEVVGVKSLIQDITEIRQRQIALLEAKYKLRVQNRRYSEVLWGANIGTWEWNALTGKVIFNERWAEMLGYSLQELEPISIDTWEKLLHPDDVNKTKEMLMRHSVGETETLECEFRMQHKNGDWIWILDRGRVIQRTNDGKAIRLSGTHQDITKSKQAEEKLKLAASVFTYARECITITDIHGDIMDVNDAFCATTGYTRDEVIGQNPRLLKSGRHSRKFYKQMWGSLEKNGHWTGEIWNKRKNGQVYPELLTISSVIDNAGVVQNYVALFNDITQIKEHQEQLERIAHYDALTRLPNRTLLLDRLNQSIRHTRRQKSSLMVAFLDLDGFKEVNDTYGHAVGDELLIAVSTQMKAALRSDDTLARVGGDEFVAVMGNVETLESCEPLLERLLLAASEPIAIDGAVLEISVSIGVATFPQDGVDADQLIRIADQAMYVAKQEGKNRYRLFDSEYNTNLVRYHEKLELIRMALDKNEFILYYQPKVNMKTGAIIGAEALIRWQSPGRGLVGPNDFLPAIENNVLSIELGEWVISSALKQIKLWNNLGLDIPVSVNISAIQLQSKDFATRLAHLLAEFPEVSPRSLELEVLETSEIGDLLQVSETMHTCIELGVTFALDDFGTGYSSLSHLRRLPANLIKIDQSFIRDMLIDPNDLVIVESVVALSRSFKRDVIAEGVETIAHGTALLELGCELAQGYAIARPMMATDIPDWSTNWHPDDAWLDLSTVNTSENL
ncbi:PAS domain S-box protein [Shewanella metallivivens]|uniref:PAS domain S-box protein n=1 Tax=Shewanella metallivivens TaxID=2872342 RepID=A0ABT5TKT3_9GAMM|nr:PAS domain S-box protein [Shewanella metallivivens]MDD8059211.1 PAS domain S-box protein [Shewanella metallivivens]